MKFSLHIDLGSEGMRTKRQLSHVLRRVADAVDIRIRSRKHLDEEFSQRIKDTDKSEFVGEWKIEP